VSAPCLHSRCPHPACDGYHCAGHASARRRRTPVRVTRERALSTGQPWRVVDGLRGPLRGPGPLPAGVRVVVEYPSA